MTLMQILLTHGHLDHVGAASELAQHYGVPVIGPEKEDEFWLQGLPAQSRMFGLDECQPLTPDRWLNDGDRVSVGNVTLQVLHCPGHTPGHVVFFDEQSQLLISGDVIFKGGVGRSDFPRGDHTQLIDAIKRKLLPLGDDVTFIPATARSLRSGTSVCIIPSCKMRCRSGKQNEKACNVQAFYRSRQSTVFTVPQQWLRIAAPYYPGSCPPRSRDQKPRHKRQTLHADAAPDLWSDR